MIQVPSPGRWGAGGEDVGEGGIEGDPEAALAQASGEAARDVEARGREDGAGVGGEPEGVGLLVGPGEDAGAVGGHDGLGGEVAAGGDEAAGGREAGVGEGEAGRGQGLRGEAGVDLEGEFRDLRGKRHERWLVGVSSRSGPSS